MKKEKTLKKSKASLIWLLIVALIAVSLLLFCQFYFGDAISSKTTFYPNTHINGVDVSGLTKAEANNIILNNLTDKKQQINITLKSEDKKWTIDGNELGFIGNIEPTLDKVIAYGHEGNIFTQKKIASKIKKEGLYINLPYEDIYVEWKPNLKELLVR